MDISVTLFGGLRHFLPAGCSFNKCSLPLAEGERLDALLAKDTTSTFCGFLLFRGNRMR